MKYIKKFNLISEKNVWEIKNDLKHFHNVLDLDVTIKELMQSLGGIHMDLKTIFPILNGDESLKDVVKWDKFEKELQEYKLKPSELFDTNDLQTFSRLHMKWYWLSTEDSTNLDTPIYILFKYYHDKKWSELQLYYIQEDIKDFLDELSTVTIEFRYGKENKRWFYKTSNSGMNWTLEKDTKKVKDDGKYSEVKSDNETATFRPNLKWDDILSLSKRSDLELYLY